MGVILGIIGGGQLGMMLAEAAKNMPNEIFYNLLILTVTIMAISFCIISKLSAKVIVLDPVQDCPATHTGASQIVADFENSDAIKELAEKSDIITYEIE